MEQIISAGLERDVLTSIYLDYGADAKKCDISELNISERGMVFKSRWQFSMGTQLAMVFSFQDMFGRAIKAETEGIVVDCEEVEGDGFLHLLIFPEITPELKAAIRDIQQARLSSRASSLN